MYTKSICNLVERSMSSLSSLKKFSSVEFGFGEKMRKTTGAKLRMDLDHMIARLKETVRSHFEL